MNRFFELILVAIAILFLFPVILVTAFLIKLKMGGKVIFSQERLGKNCKKFNLYKFRTMTDEKDGDGELLPDNQRMTKLGQFLRSSSLDELPGLLNVLKGEMALVGPRPFISEYEELYTPEENRRHNVRPGITGWAQVNGRNAISWKDKFKLDIWYVDNKSFLLDIKILFLTVRKVFISEGISAQDHATMEKYNGKN